MDVREAVGSCCFKRCEKLEIALPSLLNGWCDVQRYKIPCPLVSVVVGSGTPRGYKNWLTFKSFKKNPRVLSLPFVRGKILAKEYKFNQKSENM